MIHNSEQHYWHPRRRTFLTRYEATNKPHVLANLVTSTLAVLTLLGWAIVLFG